MMALLSTDLIAATILQFIDTPDNTPPLNDLADAAPRPPPSSQMESLISNPTSLLKPHGCSQGYFCEVFLPSLVTFAVY
jgi:hypothetical protein